METSVAKALNETDWEELIPKLVAFAHKHMCYLLADFDNMPVINGYDPKALTQEAIRRTIAGSREWEPNKVPLLDYLFGVIRSITDCEMGKHCSVNFVTPVKDNEGKLTDPTENVPDGGPTPQETTDTILISERQKIFLDSFISSIEDDDQLSALYLAMSEGFYMPKEISRETGIPSNRVSELKRKLRDRMESFSGEKLVPLAKNIIAMETQ